MAFMILHNYVSTFFHKGRFALGKSSSILVRCIS